MTHATITEAAIAELLERFYATVRADAVLGPVFAAAIADEAWPEHLRIIGDFWSSLLLKTGRYHRNPFTVHKAVPDITPAMFPRWLALFRAACDAVLVPELAEAVHRKAELIARSLQAGLFFDPAAPGQG